MKNDVFILEKFDLFKYRENIIRLLNNANFPQIEKLTQENFLPIKKFILISLFYIESYLLNVWPVNKNLCQQLTYLYFGEYSQDALLNEITIQMYPLFFEASEKIDFICPVGGQNITINVQDFLISVINSSTSKQKVAARIKGLSKLVLKQKNGDNLIRQTHYELSCQEEIDPLPKIPPEVQSTKKPIAVNPQRLWFNSKYAPYKRKLKKESNDKEESIKEDSEITDNNLSSKITEKEEVQLKKRQKISSKEINQNEEKEKKENIEIKKELEILEKPEKIPINEILSQWRFQ